MAKYFGKIGYNITEEVKPGVWTPHVVEHESFGDVIRNTRRLRSSDKVNDDIVINTELSILADPFVNENFHTIVYAEFMGARWKVDSVEPQFPRLILSLGEVYKT